VPLNLYPNVYASGSVPTDWRPSKGGVRKYRVKNAQVMQVLQALFPGTWQKVIKKGTPGAIHYFEHSSGHVADVKYFP
jgi:hypothetical protein